MSSAAVVVSKDLQQIARDLDKAISKSAGQNVSFSLFVWTEGRANYISNSTDRAEIKRALMSIIEGWDAGMPDIPAHKVI